MKLTKIYDPCELLIKIFLYLEPGSQFQNSQYWILSFWVIYVPPCCDSCLNCKSQRSVNLLFYLQHSIPIGSPFLNLEEKVDSCHYNLAFRRSHAIFDIFLVNSVRFQCVRFQLSKNRSKSATTKGHIWRHSLSIASKLTILGRWS